MLRICIAIAIVGLVGTCTASDDEQKPDSRLFFPGFWIPLNIPSPAASTTTTPVCTGCCLMQCVGGTCAAPMTCTPATPAATACFATATSATCTNTAACKAIATGTCTSTTVDCTASQTCPPAAG